MMQPDRRPVENVRDLYAMPSAELTRGFEDGRDGLECPEAATRAFWHGWRCGQIAAGLAPPAPEISDLTRKNRQIMEAMTGPQHHQWSGTIQ